METAKLLGTSGGLCVVFPGNWLVSNIEDAGPVRRTVPNWMFPPDFDLFEI